MSILVEWRDTRKKKRKKEIGNMLDMIILLAKICGAVVVGIFAGHAAVYIFNKIPAQWLCDYGQKPDEALEGFAL